MGCRFARSRFTKPSRIDSHLSLLTWQQNLVGLSGRRSPGRALSSPRRGRIGNRWCVPSSVRVYESPPRFLHHRREGSAVSGKSFTAVHDSRLARNSADLYRWQTRPQKPQNARRLLRRHDTWILSKVQAERERRQIELMTGLGDLTVRDPRASSAFTA